MSEDDTHFSDGEKSYDLVMPFVLCMSEGGPYEDDAFAAGWVCGEFDRELRPGSVWGPTLERTVRTAVLPQLDLIAMRYGYQMTSEHYGPNPEWSYITLTKV